MAVALPCRSHDGFSRRALKIAQRTRKASRRARADRSRAERAGRPRAEHGLKSRAEGVARPRAERAENRRERGWRQTSFVRYGALDRQRTSGVILAPCPQRAR